MLSSSLNPAAIAATAAVTTAALPAVSLASALAPSIATTTLAAPAASGPGTFATTISWASRTARVPRCWAPHYPGAATYWGNAALTVETASRSYLARHAIRGSWAYLKSSVLLKVIALSMVQYEVILFVDMDADVFLEP